MRLTTVTFIIGALFVLIGIMGFISSSVHSPANVNSALPVHIFNNLVYLAVGLWALAAAKNLEA